ncbi:hypothetical protein GCM10009416_12300 [Craurococcus roseus]|uniref:Uncharacterized protein n=1 Tax=Craurococcus roseus TaxID=77585 RepID=A0ABP3PTE6_9PROT
MSVLPEPENWNLSTDERERVLGSLRRVGRDKGIGYLPLYTIRDVLSLDVADLAAEVESRALSALVLGPAECCIKSGALYVFDHQRLAALLAIYSETVASSGWPTEPDSFVRAIAAHWVGPEDSILPVIRKAFGETVAA